MYSRTSTITTRRNMYSTSTSTSTSTKPQGYNKAHRDMAKILLACSSICLLADMGPFGYLSAVLPSAAATIVVSRGKVESGKNLKWVLLSVISFIASLVSASLLSGQELIDADKAYEFKTKLLFYGQFIRFVWGGILALFVASTFFSEAAEKDD